MKHYQVFKLSLNESAAKIESDLNGAATKGFGIVSATSYQVVTQNQTMDRESVEAHALIIMERQEKRRRKK